jgi:hypothetical protein
MSHARFIQSIVSPRLLGQSLVAALGGSGGSSLAGSRFHRHGLFQGVVACRGTMDVLFEHWLSLDDFKLGGHGIEELGGCIAAARLARAVDVIHILELFSVTTPIGHEQGLQ